MIKSYKRTSCDYCCSTIALHNNPISIRELKGILLEKGRIIEGNKHFCGKVCCSLFHGAKNLNNTNSVPEKSVQENQVPEVGGKDGE